MSYLMAASLLIPMLGLLTIFLSPNKERNLAVISLWFSRFLGLNIFGLLYVWAKAGFPRHEFEWFSIYSAGDYHFPILLYFDEISAVYLACIWAIFAIIVKYCRVYLHRESGYKRFFLTIFSFVFGLNLVVLSGSIDVLFAGWEIVGISSFLLIAFYRHRVQPVRNALRAFVIYRVCDVGLLLGAWMSHLLFHESQNFVHLRTMFDDGIPPAGYGGMFLLSSLIIIAASGKSAQFPFSFWLPRAMEGPTPSSAIFYGALSVHLGVFLLLRTTPIWGSHYSTRFVVFIIGLLTVLIASIAEKTQSNIKGQIAYASIAQVGFMFIELAFELELLVLIHFLGNAFLRCYQLLVSPSIVAHLLRVEGSADTDFYIKNPEARFSFLPSIIRNTLPEVLQNTLYVFSLQEGNLELIIRGLFWEPLKRRGEAINSLSLWVKILCILLTLTIIAIATEVHGLDKKYLSLPIAAGMIFASLSAFGWRNHPVKVWSAMALSSILAAIAVVFINPSATQDAVIYLTGIIPAWLLGLSVLLRLPRNKDPGQNLFSYQALAETHPKLSLLLFLSFLGLIGFPITPAFLGEDLLLSHAANHDPWFALPITIAFLINGIAGALVFQRLCMGRPNELCVEPVTSEFYKSTNPVYEELLKLSEKH